MSSLFLAHLQRHSLPGENFRNGTGWVQEAAQILLDSQFPPAARYVELAEMRWGGMLWVDIDLWPWALFIL